MTEQCNPTTERIVKRLRGLTDLTPGVTAIADETLFGDAADEIERLTAALVHSVSVVQTWHNMEVPLKQRSELWDIYWRNAPEMKQIREALRGNAT